MANSRASMQRNALVEAAMEVHAAIERRRSLDVPERAVLEKGAEIAEEIPGQTGRQMRRIFEWLLTHDHNENSDHDSIIPYTRRICHIVEMANPSALNGRIAG